MQLLLTKRRHWEEGGKDGRSQIYSDVNSASAATINSRQRLSALSNSARLRQAVPSLTVGHGRGLGLGLGFPFPGTMLT